MTMQSYSDDHWAICPRCGDESKRFVYDVETTEVDGGTLVASLSLTTLIVYQGL